MTSADVSCCVQVCIVGMQGGPSATLGSETTALVLSHGSKTHGVSVTSGGNRQLDKYLKDRTAGPPGLEQGCRP